MRNSTSSRASSIHDLRLRGESKVPEIVFPSAHACKATITGVEITRHRLHFDPPFNASWDTKPRSFWDTAIVAVHTDLGVTGYGSGDMMLGFEGHEALFVGEDALAIERHWRMLNNISFHWGRCWPLDLALWDLAGKLTGQPCWSCSAASRIGSAPTPRPVRCAGLTRLPTPPSATSLKASGR